MDGAAAALLRFACGAFFVPHAVAKLRDREPTVALLGLAGLRPPRLWLWIGIAIELGAAAGLMLNVAARLAAIAGAALLFAAAAVLLRVTRGKWRWNEGGAEFPVFWGICCLVVAWQS